MSDPKSSALPKLLLALGVCASVIWAGELGARRLVQDSIEVKRPPNLRAPNVHVFRDHGTSLPSDPPDPPMVFLVGNSHTYALPSLEKGSALLLDPGVTLIDRIASGVADVSGVKASFHRLSYPNFLPFEMILRTSFLLSKGWEPKVVVFGITYRNIVRDSEPRHGVQVVFRDPEYRRALDAMLRAPGVTADPAIFDAIRRQEEQSDREEREERMKSDADRIDAALLDSLDDRLTMLARGNDLRAVIYRWLTFDIQESFANAKDQYLYDLVESDYAFNQKCLRAYLQMLRSRGIRVFVYLAPERSDLPPMVDPARQKEFNAELATFLAGLDIPMIDARTLVPNDQWGWMLDSPDRSHFSAKGHEMLGRFIAEEGQKLGVWKALEAPR